MAERAVAGAAFEALLRHSRTLLIVVDHRLRIRSAGPVAAELAGRPADALPGMSLIAALGSVPLDAVAREALASAEPAVGETELGHRASRSFSVEGLRLPDGGVVLSLSEISALRRAERVRRDFMANISHELRTPLTSIKLLAETVADGAVDDGASARDFAVQIEREVDHLAQLVDELLDLARIESGEVSLTIAPLRPSDVIARLAERIGPMADRQGMTVRVLPPPAEPDHPMVAGDAERLGQALLNLAHNAVKYSHRGGEVRLAWSATEAAVRFEVADDGIGIPEAHRSRIFERFYKVDRSRARDAAAEPERAGAGLGLAIVRHIAEGHGGSVGVRSTHGSGSTFWVDVPRAPHP